MELKATPLHSTSNQQDAAQIPNPSDATSLLRSASVASHYSIDYEGPPRNEMGQLRASNQDLRQDSGPIEFQSIATLSSSLHTQDSDATLSENVHSSVPYSKNEAPLLRTTSRSSSDSEAGFENVQPHSQRKSKNSSKPIDLPTSPIPEIVETPFDPSKAPVELSPHLPTKKPVTISYKTQAKYLTPKARKQSLDKKLEPHGSDSKPTSDPQQLPYKPPMQSMEQPLSKSSLKWRPSKYSSFPKPSDNALQSSKRSMPSRQKHTTDQSASASLLHGKNRDSGDDAGSVGSQRAATFPRQMTKGLPFSGTVGPIIENKRNHSRASSISSEPSSLVSDASHSDPIPHSTLMNTPPTLSPSQISTNAAQNSVYWYSPFSSGLTIDLGAESQRQDPFLLSKLGLATNPVPSNGPRHLSKPPGLSHNPMQQHDQHASLRRNFTLGGPSLLWDTTKEEDEHAPQYSIPVNSRFSLFEQRF